MKIPGFSSSKKMNLPRVKPMLAKLVETPFDKEGWFFEVKWDGYRAIADVKGGKAELYSRNGKPFTAYAPVTEALEKIKMNAVFDGEIVAIKNGLPDFHSLQYYGEKKTPIQYVIFDLLYLNGKDLRSEPLQKRKEILRKIFPKDKVLVYGDYVEGEGKNFFHSIRKRGIEGMVAKDGQSRYLEGARSWAWLKVKNFNSQEAVIAGFTKPRGSRKHIGALVLGVYDGNKLKYAGHSGGGFTEKELEDLHEMLQKIKTDERTIEEKFPSNSPVTWVRPKYVCQIEFSEWTPDGRMRHPIYAGLREDKNPEEVVFEKKEKNPNPGLKFSNLDKVYWPKEGYTKGEAIEYYEKISETILPHLLDRPESLNRHPDGIEGKSFFQKDFKTKLPDFAETKEIWSEESRKKIRYILCQNKETLLYLANLGCIELNPWSSRTQSLEYPDYMIIDLDPGQKTFKELVTVAIEAKKLLDEACEKNFIKTSGKRGLHILVPLGAKYDYDTIRVFSELLVKILNKRLPELTSIERNPKKRGGKIYLDYLQNRKGQTISAPYCLRPWPGATVSTPLLWEEVGPKLNPADFNIKTVFKRIEKLGDIWKGVPKESVDLNKSIKCLGEYIE